MVPHANFKRRSSSCKNKSRLRPFRSCNPGGGKGKPRSLKDISLVGFWRIFPPAWLVNVEEKIHKWSSKKNKTSFLFLNREIWGKKLGWFTVRHFGFLYLPFCGKRQNQRNFKSGKSLESCRSPLKQLGRLQKNKSSSNQHCFSRATKPMLVF